MVKYIYMYIGSVKNVLHFLCTYIYILPFYFTSHLIMTAVRSKRRVLPLIFIVNVLLLL